MEDAEPKVLQADAKETQKESYPDQKVYMEQESVAGIAVAQRAADFKETQVEASPEQKGRWSGDRGHPEGFLDGQVESTNGRSARFWCTCTSVPNDGPAIGDSPTSRTGRS